MLPLAQLILFGLLASSATGFFVEQPSAIRSLKWTPGSSGQPKWTLDVQIKYSAIGSPYSPLLLPPFTFDDDGQPINMTVKFLRARSGMFPSQGDFEVSFLAKLEDEQAPYFNTEGKITLRNHKGLSDIVKSYDCNFNGVFRCPYYTEQTRILRGIQLEKENVITNTANGWIKGGAVHLSITFDY